jgi:hypothetical protein
VVVVTGGAVVVAVIAEAEVGGEAVVAVVDGAAP